MFDVSISDKYETAHGIKQSPGRFFFGRSLSFTIALLILVLQGRRKSLKGITNNAYFIQQSDKIRNLFERHGARFKIEGIQNLNNDKAVVIVANHMSLIESVVLHWIIGSFKPFSVVIKKELYDSWLFHPIALVNKGIPLTRKNLREDIDLLMKEGVKYLKQGRTILLFPEGTRKRCFKRSEFNSLGVKLAARAGVEVLPLALKTDFMENGKLFSEAGKIYPDRIVHFEFGKALGITGKGKKEHEEILDFIESRLRSWGAEIAGEQA